jgi:hypothetical protein
VRSISPDPKATGSISLNPKVAGSVSLDPKVMGSVSPDLEVVGFISPDPLGAVTVEGWGYVYLSLSSSMAICDLSDYWGLGGIYIPFPFLSKGNLPLLPHLSMSKVEQELSLPPLLTSSVQANPLISPSILEEKGSQTRLESSSIDFPTLKSTWFMFWLVVVFITLGAWFLAG